MGFGLFGKVPQKRDFISTGLPSAVLRPFETWLQSAVAASRNEIGQKWPDYYLVAPIWRFWLGPEVFGSACAGALMPSVDQVGRYFPLAILYVADENEALPSPLEAPAEWWYRAIEDRLLSVLDASDSADVGGLLVGLPMPEGFTAVSDTARPPEPEASPAATVPPQPVPPAPPIEPVRTEVVTSPAFTAPPDDPAPAPDLDDDDSFLPPEPIIPMIPAVDPAAAMRTSVVIDTGDDPWALARSSGAPIAAPLASTPPPAAPPPAQPAAAAPPATATAAAGPTVSQPAPPAGQLTDSPWSVDGLEGVAPQAAPEATPQPPPPPPPPPVDPGMTIVSLRGFAGAAKATAPATEAQASAPPVAPSAQAVPAAPEPDVAPPSAPVDPPPAAAQPAPTAEPPPSPRRPAPADIVRVMPSKFKAALVVAVRPGTPAEDARAALRDLDQSHASVGRCYWWRVDPDGGFLALNASHGLPDAYFFSFMLGWRSN